MNLRLCLCLALTLFGCPGGADDDGDGTIPPKDASAPLDAAIDTGIDAGSEEMDASVDASMEMDAASDGSVADSATDGGEADAEPPDVGMGCEPTGLGGNAICTPAFTDLTIGICGVDPANLPGDAGTSADAGRFDSGQASPPPCVRGAEGCDCTSSLTATSTVFVQDDCDDDLLCIPFDLIAGQQTSVTGPDQTCVRPCAADVDCGAGRLCRNMGFAAASGAESFCVDREAQLDEYCGASRTNTSVLPMVELHTPGEMVGCSGSLSCTLGFFADVHPDEGICIDFCEDPSDCTAPTPYCNRLFSAGATTAPGICSIAALGIGALCGPVLNPTGAGLTAQCDASDQSIGCIMVPGLFPGTTGFCVQGCDVGFPCTASDPGLGSYVCTTPQGSTSGICTIDCDNFPENCSGAGTYGFGRMCYDGLVLGTSPAEFCMDRLGPPSAATLLTPDGMGVAFQGDNCSSPADPLGFARCPDGANCLAAGQDQGVCVYGCAP